MRGWIRDHQLVSFFVLTYAIAYLAGFGDIYLNRDQTMAKWSLIWFLNVFSPTIAALLVSWVVGGLPEIKRLLSGFLRWNVGARWYFAAACMLLIPFAVALVYIAMGNPPTGLRAGWTIPMLLGQVFFQLFSGPASEEAGWRGFALPRLQSRYNALVSSVILGVIWTCWHLPLFFMPGQAQMGIPFPIYLVMTVALTIYMTWLYNNTRGSLAITVLSHFAYNLTGTLITGPVSLMPAMVLYLAAGPGLFLVVLGVVVYFGPRYLSRKPAAELPFRAEPRPLGAVRAA